MFRTKVWRAVFAIVLGGVLSTAAGCGDDGTVGDTGTGKGPEYQTTMESGRPIAGGASTMNQSTPQPGIIPQPPVATACRPEATCIGDFGCVGTCVDNVITSCQLCTDGVFTSCTERACTPDPRGLPITD